MLIAQEGVNTPSSASAPAGAANAKTASEPIIKLAPANLEPNLLKQVNLKASKIHGYEQRQEHFSAELKRRGISIDNSKTISIDEIGPRVNNGGIEFVVPINHKVSKLAIALFDSEHDELPYAVIPFEDKDKFQSGNITFCSKRLEGAGAKPGMRYNLVADGRLILDPKSQGVAGDLKWLNPEGFNKADSGVVADGVILDELYKAESFKNTNVLNIFAPRFTMPKSVVLESIAPTTDTCPQWDINPASRVIYRFHPSSTLNNEAVPPEHRGKYSALPYIREHLKSLGVTTIFCAPLHYSIDEALLKQQQYIKEHGEAGANAEGYNTAHDIGLNPDYFHSSDPAEMREELRKINMLMTGTSVEDGFEMGCDLVVAHNCEASPGEGPAMGKRVLCDSEYFHITEAGDYVNASGCGNTTNVNSMLTKDLIISTAKTYKDDYGFKIARVDQGNILMRNMDLSFNPDSEAMFYMSQIFGEMNVYNETADQCHPETPYDNKATALHYGEYPIYCAEIPFRKRDAEKAFYSGEEVMPYHPGYKHPKYNKDAKLPPENVLAYADSNNSDIYESSGKNRGVSFAAAHDGQLTLDLAIEIYEKHKLNEDLRKNEAYLRASEQERIYAYTRAIEWDGLLTPGQVMIPMGSETLRTQQNRHSAWNNKGDLGYNTHPEDPAEQRHLESTRKIMNFRKENERFFERDTFFTEEEMTWTTKDGSQRSDWSKATGFRGQMYHANGERFSEGSIYKVHTNHACTVTLPKAPEGLCWVRRADSQLVDPEKQFEEKEIHSSYEFHFPLITAAFELRSLKRAPRESLQQAA